MSSLAGALIPRESPVKHPQPVQDEDMEDLFGNDDNDVASAAASEDNLPTPERERRRAQEYGEDDPPAEITMELREALVEFPNIPVPKSSNGENWVLRTPTFVNVDSKPFHPDTYVGPEHDDELLQADNREKSMTIKLKVENTLRWRWTKDDGDRDTKQSNSRVVRWSDGSLSLLLGKELFDINKSADTSSGSKPAGPSTPGKNAGLTYIVAQHKRSQVLQAEAPVTGYMTLRPMGMQSETHRMLVRAVGQRHNKIARLRIAPDPTIDPEREKKEMEKQSARKRRKTDGERRRQRKAQRPSIWSDEEEGMYPSEDEDEGPGATPKRPKTKARHVDDNDKEVEYQHDGFVVGDSDEEDSDGGGGSSKRRKPQADDELDRLDAQIDAKWRRSSGGKSNEEMDVESEEEEEDEHRVRRTGGSRRRLVDEEEEEEE